MKLSKELQDALNEQMGNEFAASYSYLAMAAYFESTAWDGFAKWMTLQSEEERGHAMKFYHYLLDRGGKVSLPALSAPKGSFKSPLEVFESALAQERGVSKSIYGLYDLAHKKSDFATVSFLKWFVDEQVEEEKSVSDMIEKLKRAGDNPESTLFLDRFAGERAPEAPTT